MHSTSDISRNVLLLLLLGMLSAVSNSLTTFMAVVILYCPNSLVVCVCVYLCVCYGV